VRCGAVSSREIDTGPAQRQGKQGVPRVADGEHPPSFRPIISPNLPRLLAA